MPDSGSGSRQQERLHMGCVVEATEREPRQQFTS